MFIDEKYCVKETLLGVNNSDNLIIFAASKIHRSCILSSCVMIILLIKSIILWRQKRITIIRLALNIFAYILNILKIFCIAAIGSKLTSTDVDEKILCIIAPHDLRVKIVNYLIRYVSPSTWMLSTICSITP